MLKIPKNLRKLYKVTSDTIKSTILRKKPEKIYSFPATKNKLVNKENVKRRSKKLLKLKNNGTTLDDIDLKILEALQEDASQTYMAIGKRLGLAHSTVYDRIKRMEEHKIIEKYTAIVNSEKLGNKKVTAIMTIYTDPKESEKIAEKICQASEILEVYTSLSEELQIIAKVVADNQENLHEFIADSIAPLPGVLRIRTSLITKKFKETPFMIGNNSKTLTLIKQTSNIDMEK